MQGEKSGFLLVNKPEGISSFKVVKRVRYLSKVKRVGHAGTLDPFASGLLILALGRDYTRRIDEMMGLEKVYTVGMTLGRSTTTLDPEGEITSEIPYQGPQSNVHFEQILKSFEGSQEQMPPDFSAKKINGKKAYELARQGKPVTLKPSLITIHKITLLAVDFGQTMPYITFQVRCSKGTYIRSLVRDIGTVLECSAMTTTLIRDAIGPHLSSNALSYDPLSEETISNALFTLPKA